MYTIVGSYNSLMIYLQLLTQHQIPNILQQRYMLWIEIWGLVYFDKTADLMHWLY